MNGFERRKERKREGIRRAALELFRVYGFQKVSVKAIAHKANVSQVTIYNHFGSKEDLVREVVKTLLNNMLERYQEILREETPFPEKLETIVFDKADIASQFEGELVQVVYQSDPELKDFIETLWQEKANQLTLDLFEEGKRLGYVDPELSMEAILVYLEILRKGVAASSALLAKLEPSVDLFRELNYLFLYGLAGKTEQQRYRSERTQSVKSSRIV